MYFLLVYLSPAQYDQAPPQQIGQKNIGISSQLHTEPLSRRFGFLLTCKVNIALARFGLTTEPGALKVTL